VPEELIDNFMNNISKDNYRFHNKKSWERNRRSLSNKFKYNLNKNKFKSTSKLLPVKNLYKRPSLHYNSQLPSI